ncbi:MAG TPA: PQQ-binding-like beta-propeller repeat protein [Solirubrobacteraceae bacterium]|nr:PQQ-binding-like beta-propeller repeat protein [Solirubrobacteraceae bacterium]
MRAGNILRQASWPAICLLLAACGSSAPSETSEPMTSGAAIPAPARAASSPAKELLDWPEFGIDPQRTDVSEDETGITSANVGHLRHITVTLAGTVDSSPIYLHDVLVDGAVHNTIIVTTTYGRTIALDAQSGRILWVFTPPGIDRWAGTPQITTASPLADPDRRYVYATSPNGLIHKLSIADGAEAAGWPVSITLEPLHEKIAPALNIDGPDLLATTGGYLGDIPPYQGHVVVIERATGRLLNVFNTLCSNRRRLILPSSCPASDSAIWARSGAVVEPGGARILIATGNGPWNGTTNFGDSVLELSFPGLSLLQSFTPTDQEYLNDHDLDLGSSAPVLLGEDRIVLAGKDAIMRVLVLSRLDGSPPNSARARSHPLGGEVQHLKTPGDAKLFSAPAVWRRDGRTTVFVADENATAAYVLRNGLLQRAWENSNPGTSPVMAGGLLYVYDLSAGGIFVYLPDSGRPIAKLPGEPGHWNSPIVVDGHVIEPEGNANNHQLSGRLEIFSIG